MLRTTMAGRVAVVEAGDSVRLAAMRLIMQLTLRESRNDLRDEEQGVATLLLEGADESSICSQLDIPLPDLAWTLIRLCR